jgi:molybdenum cofactor cytidylyltransferase
MDAPRRTAAILLAAGRSERFGAENKLLAILDGRPLISHAIAILAEMDFGALIAVCDPEGQPSRIARASGFTIVSPSEPGNALACSIAAGVRTASALPGIEAALICLADMPFISRDHINRLIDAHDAQNAMVVASFDGETAMPPALFGRDHFAQLQNLRGDIGAKSLLQNAHLIYADTTTLTDIDTVEDLDG